MKRKISFWQIILIFATALSLITTSCSTGIEEKGEVSFTFTEPMLRKIFSRGADITSEQEGSDYSTSELIPTNNILATYPGIYYINKIQKTAVLYIFKDGNYAVYDSEKMSSLASSFQKMVSEIYTEDGNIDQEKLAAYQALASNPYSIFDDAVISKGSWKESTGNSVSITETHYYDFAKEELTEVSNPGVIATISTAASTFTIQSNAGISITFYSKNIGDDDNPTVIVDKDNDYYGNPKILVELKAGGKTYPKEVDVIEVEAAMVGKLEGDEKTDILYILFAYSDGTFVIQDYKDRKFISLISKGRWESVNDEIIAYPEGSDEPLPISDEDDFPYTYAEGKTIHFSEEYLTDEFTDNFKYLPVSVSFSNLPIGVKGSVKAKITYAGYTVATGESVDFIISNNTSVNVKLKISTGFEQIDEPEKPNHSRYPMNITVSGFPADVTFNDSRSRMYVYMISETSPAAELMEGILKAKTLTDNDYLAVFDLTNVEYSSYGKKNATSLGMYGDSYSPITLSKSTFTFDTDTGEYAFSGNSSKTAYVFATLLTDDGNYYLALPEKLETFKTSGTNISLNLKDWKVPYEIYAWLQDDDLNGYTVSEDYSVKFLLDNIADEDDEDGVYATKLAALKDTLTAKGYKYNSYKSGGKSWSATFGVSYYFDLVATGGSVEIDPVWTISTGSKYETSDGNLPENYSDSIVYKLTAKNSSGLEIQNITWSIELTYNGVPVPESYYTLEGANLTLSKLPKGVYILRMIATSDNMTQDKTITLTIN